MNTMTASERTAVNRSTTNGHVLPTAQIRPANPQLIARVTGVLFLITFLTSVPALLLFDPVRHDPGYIIGAGADAQVLLGAFLELLLIIANIGSALVPFAILKRQNEGLALGFVAARVMESVFIAVGLLSVLAVVTLRQQAAGMEPGTLVVVGQTLVAIKEWTFVLGPGFVVGIGNGLMLGYLMYRSGLMPWGLAVLGMIAGPLVCATGIGVLFGLIEAGSAPTFITAIPEMIWELSVGFYLTIKGFRPTPLTGSVAASQPARTAISDLLSPA
jgi:hypothetical protein